MTKLEEARLQLTELELKSIQKQISHWNNHAQIVEIMRSRYLNDCKYPAALAFFHIQI